jgi:hypothetical protein
VNGQPSRGTVVRNRRTTTLRTAPNPGKAIADIVRSGVVEETPLGLAAGLARAVHAAVCAPEWSGADDCHHAFCYCLSYRAVLLNFWPFESVPFCGPSLAVGRHNHPTAIYDRRTFLASER